MNPNSLKNLKPFVRGVSGNPSGLKKIPDELVGYLCQSQTFPQGSMLLTGTGVVPDDDFTLVAGDMVRIAISGIGTLENKVAVV